MADTIGTLIDGIANSKSNIADAIENKGVTVPSGTKLAGMASLINQISTMHGPASSTDGNLAAFDGIDGDTLKDSGIAMTNVATKTGNNTFSGSTTFTGSVLFDTSDNSITFGGMAPTFGVGLNVGTSGSQAAPITFFDTDSNVIYTAQLALDGGHFVIQTHDSEGGTTYGNISFPSPRTSNVTLAITDDIPSVLGTGASNKDKYLHTNASTGALEWSSLSVTDTKNTAGSTNDTSLLYLIGAKTQAANPQTYSRNNTYINANGVLVNTTGFSSQSAGSPSNGGLLTLNQNEMSFKAGPSAAKLTLNHNANYGSLEISDNGGNVYLKKTGSAASGSSPDSAYLKFPNVGTSSAPKTLATTDDIPDDSNLVHRTGDESITGVKTFYHHTSDQYIYYKTTIGSDKISLQRINSTMVADDAYWSSTDFYLKALSDVNATFKSNSVGFNIEVPASDGSNVPISFNLEDSNSNTYSLVVPYKDGTLATIEDFETETSKYQSTSVVVGNATTNINGRVFQNYTATLVTSGGYTFYQILKNGNNPTEDEAKEYMRYMTGSMFLPKYNYDFPKQTIFTFADRSTWKPQYSSNDGLRLYRLTTPLALEGDVPTNLENGTGTDAIQQKQDGTSGTFDFTNKNPNATALDPTLTGQIAYGGVGDFATSFGGKSQATGKRSLAQGTTTIAKGKYSHAEGDNSVAYGDDSHAEGFATLSAGLASHTEGSKTQVLTTLPESGGGGDTPVDPPAGFLPNDHRGEASHAEGSLTVVYGFSSHAEGANTIVKGHYAHAEGVSTMAVGAGSKSYGNHSTANGDYSVAGGSYTTSNQIGSFAHGYGASTYAEYSTAFGDNTQTVRRAQFAIGSYNIGKTETLFEVGNGTSNSRGNALEVYADGHVEVGAESATGTNTLTITVTSTGSYPIDHGSYGVTDLPVSKFEALYNYINNNGSKTVSESSSYSSSIISASWQKTTLDFDGVRYNAINCNSGGPGYYLYRYSSTEVRMYSAAIGLMTTLTVYKTGTDSGVMDILSPVQPMGVVTINQLNQLRDELVNLKKYEHNITITTSIPTGTTFTITFKLINDSSNQLGGMTSNVAAALYNAGYVGYNSGFYRTCPASGLLATSTSIGNIVNLYASSTTNLYVGVVNFGSVSGSDFTIQSNVGSINYTNISSSSVSIQDFVRTI